MNQFMCRNLDLIWQLVICPRQTLSTLCRQGQKSVLWLNGSCKTLCGDRCIIVGAHISWASLGKPIFLTFYFSNWSWMVVSWPSFDYLYSSFWKKKPIIDWLKKSLIFHYFECRDGLWTRSRRRCSFWLDNSPDRPRPNQHWRPIKRNSNGTILVADFGFSTRRCRRRTIL